MLKTLRDATLWAAAPLAMTNSTAEIYGAVAKALDVYAVILILRVLLTWFKGIQWSSEPFNTLRQFTDPFLNLFRGIVPPIAGIDLSVMIGFFLLSFVRNTLRKMSMGF